MTVLIFYLVPHDLIISLEERFWAHKTGLTPSLFIESACTKPGQRGVLYLCVSGIDFVSTIFLSDFGNVFFFTSSHF